MKTTTKTARPAHSARPAIADTAIARAMMELELHAHRLPSCQMTVTTTRSSPVDAPRRDRSPVDAAPAAAAESSILDAPDAWRYPSTLRPTFATSCPTRRSRRSARLSPTICPTSSTPSRRRSAIWRAPVERDSLGSARRCARRA